MKEQKSMTIMETAGSDVLIINRFSLWSLKYKLRQWFKIRPRLRRIKCWFVGHTLTIPQDKRLLAEGPISFNCERKCDYPIGMRYLLEMGEHLMKQQVYLNEEIEEHRIEIGELSVQDNDSETQK